MWCLFHVVNEKIKLQSYRHSLTPEAVHTHIAADAVFLFDEGDSCLYIIYPFGVWQDDSALLCFVVDDKNAVVFSE